jgi:ammonia channel protein AmtB
MVAPASPLTADVSIALALPLLLLSPLAIAGLALVNAGLGRSRSAAQSVLGSLVLVSVAVLVFALIGATFADGFAGPGHVFQLSGKPWNWAGTGPIALSGLAVSPIRAQLALLFEFLTLALAVLIPWGSGADRWRLTAGAASAAILAALIFPFVAHWT